MATQQNNAQLVRVDTAHSEPTAGLLRELVAHLRQHRTQLREDWARRITRAQLLTAMTEEEIFAEATSVYDNYVEALETGTFHHPDGRTDELGMVRLVPSQAGMLAYLVAQSPKPLTVEVGFGMGSSAAIILGTRRVLGKPFAHLIFDPYGLSGGRGKVVESYLERRFPRGFRRVRERS